MDDPLRQQRAAADWASSGQAIEFKENVKFFDGLLEVLEDDLSALDDEEIPADWRDGSIVGALRFAFSTVDDALPVMTGSVEATVVTVCQRCLKPFQWQLRIDPKLIFLDRDGPDDLIAEYEIWELVDGALTPKAVIDELLVMAMPLSAKHDDPKKCGALSSEDENASKDTTRPFAALREQMQNAKQPQ